MSSSGSESSSDSGSVSEGSEDERKDDAKQERKRRRPEDSRDESRKKKREKKKHKDKKVCRIRILRTRVGWPRRSMQAKAKKKKKDSGKKSKRSKKSKHDSDSSSDNDEAETTGPVKLSEWSVHNPASQLSLRSLLAYVMAQGGRRCRRAPLYGHRRNYQGAQPPLRLRKSRTHPHIRHVSAVVPALHGVGCTSIETACRSRLARLALVDH
jgi:hypothetical protein